ncbi:MAG: 2-dehydropantoate 2-reductase [Lactobacillus sp.]|jgi:2-dehydropantoate 2-reductase|uniref:2-dehydropantoate 2-reductase n=1 Tax=Lacticaseibacillus suilingensis TaxID=2799577 RepID=A0ABW4BBH3_9LACO|nr:2-dehydropantoate 2-reductase [Lacticaseibacillus suilingensis]MCI1894355.1 2-dehydropantoate 2-reductase [Lactobacillus sp.]MCI1917300.1 2-dehydropantoate 2-reductase [Lactobacillus sp.]MCI1941083.1 2-dehydropantoate 2-reductase [Lactobacillus sp.]MCI1971626.1 2-dehydropantoate 2-reductase [Lactobacillus sp.]MCI2016287.1 2-dehydropantoate 2-reductase [Lactobacillus sp.]
MKITVLGVGGMGSRFALMLHQAGNDVTLVDGWQTNIDAIRQDGIQANFNGKAVSAKMPIYSPAEIEKSGVQADLIVVFLKSNQLKTMFDQVKALIHPDTYVLCLLNGIGHEDVLEQYVAKDHLILGITMWTAGMTGPGHVELVGDGEVELQNFAPAGKDFALQVVNVFDKAGLHPKYSENVKYSIWRKACVNGTLNCLCALLDCNIGQFGKTKEAPDMLHTIIAEFAAVAAKEGVKLDQTEVYNHVAATFTANIADHYPSMHQDLVQHHRLTEIDFIDGAVARKGEKYDIPTPYCKLLTQLVHAKEQLIGAK